MTVVLMALAGGLGAAARFALDGWVRDHHATVVPWGTWLVNVVGSLALGVVTALVARDGMGSGWSLVLGTGFCGGFTTFSTACLETVRLWGKSHPVAGLVNLVGMALVCICAAALGFELIG